MPISTIPIFSMLRTKMHWHQERQRILAENVANADTPGFHARDLEPLDFDRVLRAVQRGPGAGVRLAATEPGHFAAGAGAAALDGPPRVERVEGERAEETPTGNAVVLEEEMMKVSRTAAEYELTANLYERHLGMLRLAIGRPRGR